MISQQTRSRRWGATSSCPGVLVADACWILGGPGRGCPETCSDLQNDEQMTLRQSSSHAVVLALTVRYGLPPWWWATTLDQPCEPVPFTLTPRATGDAIQTARFLYLLETQTWDCFQGESLLHVSPVFRSPCACSSPRSAAALQWSSAATVSIVYAGGLLLLVLSLCAWCCYCGLLARPRDQTKPAPRRDLLSRLGFGKTCGEFHTDSPLFRMSAWRIYQSSGDGGEQAGGRAAIQPEQLPSMPSHSTRAAVRLY